MQLPWISPRLISNAMKKKGERERGHGCENRINHPRGLFDCRTLLYMGEGKRVRQCSRARTAHQKLWGLPMIQPIFSSQISRQCIRPRLGEKECCTYWSHVFDEFQAGFFRLRFYLSIANVVGGARLCTLVLWWIWDKEETVGVNFLLLLNVLQIIEKKHAISAVKNI